MTRTIARTAAIAFSGLLALTASGQTTWFVDTAGTPPGTGTALDPYTSIQYAIDQAATQNGDTLDIAPGTYVESVDVTKSLILFGSFGPHVTTILAAAAGPVVRTSGGSTRLTGLTIAGGFGPGGDGVDVVPGSPTDLLGCILRDNERHGIFGDYDVTVDRCTIVRSGQRALLSTGFPNGMSATHCIMVDNGLEPDFGAQLGQIQFNMIDLGTLGDVVGEPRFWNSFAHDFFLRPDSDAIDAGSSQPAQLDPDGSPADIGAIVFDPQHPDTPSSYCTAKLNSLGCTPQIGSGGAASASGALFSITCGNVMNNKSGLLFYGYEPKASPYQGGWLCVQAPVKRTALQNSGGNPPPNDCSGQFAYDFDARIQSGVDPGLAAGAAVYAQYWYRDPASSFTTGRSDGLYFVIGP